MRNSLKGIPASVYLIAVIAMGIMATSGQTLGSVLPGDLWLRAGETFVEMTTANTPLCGEASGWGYPDGTCSSTLVNGNCADSSDSSDPPELVMTIPGLAVDTDYAIDVILATDRNGCDGTSQMYSYGLKAGSSTGPATFYHTNNTPALVTGSATGGDTVLSLNRVSVGNFQSTSSGDLLIYMDDAKDHDARSLIDGIVYRLPETPPVASIITSVDRSNGAASSSAPIGDYDSETDPLAQSDYGLQLGALAYSEWPVYFDAVDEPLRGADYVRTINRDRKDDYPDVTYSVTLGGSTEDDVFLMLMVDDDVEDAGGEQQAMVNAVVSGFAGAGEFQDTGWDVDLSGNSTPHTLSAFGKWVPGGTTYTFEGPDGGSRMYVIGAKVPEPSSIMLLIGGLACLMFQRRRK